VTAAPAYRPFWRRVLLAPVLVLLGVNAAAFFAFTLPRSLSERSVAARASTLRREVGVARTRAAALARRSEAMASNAEDARRFYAEVVKARQEALLPALAEIQKVAEDLGLRLRSHAYDSEAVKGAPLVRIEVSMPVSGSYRQLVSFLDRIERSSRFLFVDGVELRERAGAGAELSVRVSAYFLAPEEKG
jgi:Tfp pilus assembly protein PilO